MDVLQKISLINFVIIFVLFISRNEGRRRRDERVENFRQKEKDVLDSILGSKNARGHTYDARIRPQSFDPVTNITDPSSSTLVTVNIYLRTINDINDYKMEFAVQITFRQKWNDPRLRFDDQKGRMKYLTMTDPRKVWMPDTFFRNEKSGHFHNILVNNVYIRIFPNGDVLYSIRISLTLSCPMNLKLYPMDRQTCALKIASYGYTTDDITYLWDNADPVQLAQNLNLPRFNIEKYSSSYCNVKTNTGEYSCLSVDLVFKRQFSYYLITIYVPGSMLVIVSWVNFWLDPKAVPARVALGVTTLLTMSTQTASINSALPPVAYTKAIDVWQGVCVGFVFSALMEYALVNYALRGKGKRKRKLSEVAAEIESQVRLMDQTMVFSTGQNGKSKTSPKSNHLPDHLVLYSHSVENGDSVENRRNSELEQQFKLNTGGNILMNPLLEDPAYLNWLEKQDKKPSRRCQIPQDRSKRIDVVSRYLFPLIFAIFNLAYWSTYLTQARNEFELLNLIGQNGKSSAG